MGLFDFFKKKREQQPTNVPPKVEHKPTQRTAQTTSSQSVKNASHSTQVSMATVENLVNEVLRLEHSSDKSLLKQKLNTLATYFSGKNGNAIISKYKNKDNLCLCFSFFIHYLGGSEAQKTTWAENAFYCIVEHLEHQNGGQQGQAEACIIYFIMLCIGRNYLKSRLQKVIDTEVVMNATTMQPLFDAVDTVKGAQNVIDQFSLIAISGARALGQAAIQPMMTIGQRYNGMDLFANTIKRTDLMRYTPDIVFDKMRFLKNEIAKSMI